MTRPTTTAGPRDATRRPTPLREALVIGYGLSAARPSERDDIRLTSKRASRFARSS